MQVRDSLFGEARINDGVIVELIKSRAVQRLKNIAQQGIPGEFLDKSVPAYSRYLTVK